MSAINSFVQNCYPRFLAVYNSIHKEEAKTTSLQRIEIIQTAIGTLQSSDKRLALLSQKLTLLTTLGDEKQLKATADEINGLFLVLKTAETHHQSDDLECRLQKFQEQQSSMQEYLLASYAPETKKFCDTYPEFIRTLKLFVQRVVAGEYGAEIKNKFLCVEIEKHLLLKLFFFDFIANKGNTSINFPCLHPRREECCNALQKVAEQTIAKETVVAQSIAEDIVYDGLAELQQAVLCVAPAISNATYNSLVQVVGSWVLPSDDFLFQAAARAYFAGDVQTSDKIASCLSSEEQQRLLQEVILFYKKGVTAETIVQFNAVTKLATLRSCTLVLSEERGLVDTFQWITQYEHLLLHLPAHVRNAQLSFSLLSRVCIELAQQGRTVDLLQHVTNLSTTDACKDQLFIAIANEVVTYSLENALLALSFIKEPKWVVRGTEQLFEKIVTEETLDEAVSRVMNIVTGNEGLSGQYEAYFADKFLKHGLTTDTDRLLYDALYGSALIALLRRGNGRQACTLLENVTSIFVYAQVAKKMAWALADTTRVEGEIPEETLINAQTLCCELADKLRSITLPSHDNRVFGQKTRVMLILKSNAIIQAAAFILRVLNSSSQLFSKHIEDFFAQIESLTLSPSLDAPIFLGVSELLIHYFPDNMRIVELVSQHYIKTHAALENSKMQANVRAKWAAYIQYMWRTCPKAVYLESLLRVLADPQVDHAFASFSLLIIRHILHEFDTLDEEGETVYALYNALNTKVELDSSFDEEVQEAIGEETDYEEEIDEEESTEPDDDGLQYEKVEYKFLFQPSDFTA